MGTKVILKIYRDARFKEPSIQNALESFQKDSSYLQNKYDIHTVKSNKRDMTIEIPGYKIYYVHNVNDNPHKIQGFRADVIEIMDNCLDQEVLRSVIYPMVNGGAELIFIPESVLEDK